MMPKKNSLASKLTETLRESMNALQALDDAQHKQRLPPSEIAKTLKQIKAHLNILSACSPVFKDILKKEKYSQSL